MSTPSLLNIPYRLKAGTLYSQLPETGAGDFTVTRTTTPTAGQSTRINSLGNIELVANNVPRLDYPLGGAVNGCPALLVEPAATNSIRNNSMVGAVAGSPGTLPTNWSSSGSGLTRQSVATGTLNGIPYVDIRVSGTATNTFYDIFWEASNVIAASIAQDWVASCYLQIVAQPNPPVNYTLAMREFTSGGGFLGVFQGSNLSVSTTSFNRFSFTRALNQASVAFVNPSLFAVLVNGQTYDFTIRIGYPQMERGTVPTSVIPTTTAAVTRNADVVSVSGAVSGAIGQTEGTMYAEVDVRNLGYNGVIAIIQTNDWVADSIQIQKVLGNVWRFTIRVASAIILNIDAGAITAGIYKVALAYSTASSGTVLAVNGSIISTQTASSIPACNSLVLGARNQTGTFSIHLNDRIRAAALYTTRLTNDELQALTA